MSVCTDAGISGTAIDVAIAGVVTAVPKTVVTNDAFNDQFSADEISNVVKMIGVRERRRVRPGQTTSDLCEAAASRLLRDLGWKTSDVQLLVLVTQTPDFALPASACVLHARLGLGPDCAAFDVNLGCSGYVYGLWLVGRLLQAGGIQRALLLAGDATSYYCDPADRATALLFGDAGSATAIESKQGATPWRFILGTDGKGASNLIVHRSATRQVDPEDARVMGRNLHRLFMDGGEIFNFTLSAVPRLAAALLEHSSATAGEFDAFLFHQANTFMIKHLAKKLKLDSERVPMNLEHFGNTSSASIPLLMSDVLADRLRQRSARIAMFGFGVGYSWAAADITTDPLRAAAVIEL